ncbi:MAG: hypothetical protein U0169_26290 [Polyangiaceae bacterium]
MRTTTSTSSESGPVARRVRAIGTLGLACMLALSTVTPTVASAEPTAADLETARSLYKQGMEARARGDRATALEKLRAANAVGQTPITGLEYGRTLLDAEQFVEAREVFLSVARLKVQADESARSEAARAEAATLAEKTLPKIGGILVELAKLPESAPKSSVAEVKVDDASIPAVALSAERKVNPGRHEVTARYGTGPWERVEVTVLAGETKTVPIAPKWVPEATATTDSPTSMTHATSTAPTSTSLHPLFWVGLGGAVLGAGVGGVAGGIAIAKGATLRQACPDPARCTPNAQPTYQAGRAAALVSTVGFAAAGAFVALGAVGFFLRGPRETPEADAPRKTAAGSPSFAPYVSPEGAGIVGSF